MAKTKHPMQPLQYDRQRVLRFKENRIVSFLADGRLNELACMDFPREDWQQLAQLIGYSLSGYSELSYVTDKAYELALASVQSATAPTFERVRDAIAVRMSGHTIPSEYAYAWEHFLDLLRQVDASECASSDRGGQHG